MAERTDLLADPREIRGHSPRLVGAVFTYGVAPAEQAAGINTLPGFGKPKSVE